MDILGLFDGLFSFFPQLDLAKVLKSQEVNLVVLHLE